MGLLFQRVWRITVGSLQMTSNDVEFTVKKTLKPEPNTADIKIYNLTAAHRQQISQAASVPVMVEVGLNQQLARIFLGQLRAGWTVTDGPENVTEISTGDGEASLATGRLNVSLGPGTPVATALQEIAAALGVDPGNIQQAIALLQSSGYVQFNTKGVVLKGNAADHMTDICKGAGLEWSVQDGAIQVLTLGQPLAGQALLLSPSTGLEGSPSVDSKGILTFDTLMVPGIRPGQLVVMQAANVPSGGYRIETCEYHGNTLSDDWGVKCSGSKF